MSLMLEFLLGTVICVLFIAWVRRFGARQEVRAYAVGLIVAALVYLGFALKGRMPGRLFVGSLAVLILMSVLAWLGNKVSATFLGIGWALHAGFDGFMHGIPEVPVWYPPTCLVFDLILAAYIFFNHRHLRRTQV